MVGERFELEWREAGGLRWLQWEGAGVAAAFPTREGGVSPPPYDSLDLGLSVGDAPGLGLPHPGERGAVHLAGYDEPFLGHAQRRTEAPPVLQHVARRVVH